MVLNHRFRFIQYEQSEVSRYSLSVNTAHPNARLSQPWRIRETQQRELRRFYVTTQEAVPVPADVPRLLYNSTPRNAYGRLCIASRHRWRIQISLICGLRLGFSTGSGAWRLGRHASWFRERRVARDSEERFEALKNVSAHVAAAFHAKFAVGPRSRNDFSRFRVGESVIYF